MAIFQNVTFSLCGSSKSAKSYCASIFIEKFLIEITTSNLRQTVRLKSFFLEITIIFTDDFIAVNMLTYFFFTIHFN